ncbi:MAG TPA: molybdenum cofactor biosynthesis protein MoaE [Tessaracoccus flavescens]|uniref:Molybdenum cofactor biosynthesis protein MoaE n=1 Tax=Tessaracoccus flavescens TaxID=399497 RepID=A0A921JQT4_9ACTN|nr:molybdenum cofactor biosynthesis protein MoaE [Tessaracoccus flavescens]
MNTFAGVTDVDIDPAELLAVVADDRAGGVVTFSGIVRNHDHGHAVTGIEYVGHPSADGVMKDVVAEFSQREGVHAVAAQHRVGSLGIGGIALYVAVSASHRRQAFDCASDLVDRVKEVLPIWKKQFLADGTYEWSQCP